MESSESAEEVEESIFNNVEFFGFHLEHALNIQYEYALSNAAQCGKKIRNIYEQRSEEITDFLNKFSEYQTLLKEAKVRSTGRVAELENSLELYKQENQTLSNRMQRLEKDLMEMNNKFEKERFNKYDDIFNKTRKSYEESMELLQKKITQHPFEESKKDKEITGLQKSVQNLSEYLLNVAKEKENLTEELESLKDGEIQKLEITIRGQYEFCTNQQKRLLDATEKERFRKYDEIFNKTHKSYEECLELLKKKITQHSVEESDKDKEMTSLRKSVQRLSEYLLNLEKEKENLTKELQGLKDSEQTIRDQDESCTKLQRELLDTMFNLDCCKKEKEKLLNEMQDLQNQGEAEKAQLKQQHQLEVNNAKVIKNQMAQENTKLLFKAEKLETEINIVTSTCDKLKKQLSRQKQVTNRLTTQVQDQGKLLAECKDQIVRKEAQLEMRNNEIAHMTAVFKTLTDLQLKNVVVNGLANLQPNTEEKNTEIHKDEVEQEEGEINKAELVRSDFVDEATSITTNSSDKSSMSLE